MPVDPVQLAGGWHATLQQQATISQNAIMSFWGKVDPGNIEASWTAMSVPVQQHIQAAQVAAAQAGRTYVNDMLKAVGAKSTSPYVLQPFAFMDNQLTLSSLLAVPRIQALTAIGKGASPAQGLAAGGRLLSSINHSAVSGAGTDAVAAAMACEKQFVGYVRHLVPPSCGRCIQLAGRFYQWNAGFNRHPNDDCVHMPVTEAQRANQAAMSDATTDPKKAFEAMSKEQQNKAYGAANAEKIRKGADMNKVVNAERNTYRSRYPRSPDKGRTPVERILRQKNKTRDQIIEDLKSAGYVTKKPLPPAKKVVAKPPASKPVTTVTSTAAKTAPATKAAAKTTTATVKKATAAPAKKVAAAPAKTAATKTAAARSPATLSPYKASSTKAITPKKTVLTDIKTTRGIHHLDPVEAKRAVNDKLVTRCKDIPDRELLALRARGTSARSITDDLDQIFNPKTVWRHDGNRWIYDERASRLGHPPAGARMAQRGYRATPDTYAYGADPKMIEDMRSEVLDYIVREWAGSSGDHRPFMVGIQDCARELFGLTETWMPGGTAIKREMQAMWPEWRKDAAKKVLQAMYDETQAFLKSQGITEIKVFRGMNAADTAEWRAAIAKSRLTGRSDPISVRFQPMSSWSSEKYVANGFPGPMLEANIPANRIIGTPRSGFGCLGEYEYVSLAGKETVTMIRYRG